MTINCLSVSLFSLLFMFYFVFLCLLVHTQQHKVERQANVSIISWAIFPYIFQTIYLQFVCQVPASLLPLTYSIRWLSPSKTLYIAIKPELNIYYVLRKMSFYYKYALFLGNHMATYCIYHLFPFGKFVNRLSLTQSRSGENLFCKIE